jgi:hypothetical protein
MKDFLDVCGAAERSLAKETVYTEELVETSAGSVLVAFSGDRYHLLCPFAGVSDTGEQSSGSESGSTGSTCFWASRIRIH